MPNILERLVQQLQDKGMPKSKAFAVATKTLQRTGSLKPGTQELTLRGKQRSAMGAAGRAKDRAAKQGGGKPEDYVYNPRTNIARKKPGFVK